MSRQENVIPFPGQTNRSRGEGVANNAPSVAS
jgi:hypothetical protein